MKQREPCVVVTFHTTAEAMATEKLCRDRALPGKLISAPRSLTADCGIAWKAPEGQREVLERALAQAEIEVAGIFELLI